MKRNPLYEDLFTLIKKIQILFDLTFLVYNRATVVFIQIAAGLFGYFFPLIVIIVSKHVFVFARVIFILYQIVFVLKHISVSEKTEDNYKV